MKCENCVRPDPCGGKVNEDGECGLHRTAEEWKREHADHHEPLSAILAEMRADVADGENAFFIRADWLALCDRIEAAAEREYAEAKDYFDKLHDGPSMICTAKNCAIRNIGLSLAASPRKFDEAAFDEAVSKPNGWSDVTDPVAEIRRMRGDEQPGNAAAMRAALERLDEHLHEDDYDGHLFFNLFDYDPKEEIRAALAAPARNCDTVRDGREALGWCRESVAVERDAAYDRGMRDAIRWLLAPAKKGGDHA